MAYTTIKKPSDYFNTVLYTGNGSTQSITGVGFQPDWSWFKVRSEVGSHRLVDAVRGNTKYLFSNVTDAEATVTTNVTSFDSDGFSLGNGSVNENTRTYASWNWLGANGTASNTVGDINSTVSVNTTSGFSIVSYTGTGSNATVGHGLGVTPKIIIVKNRAGINNPWWVYTSTIGAGGQLRLNTTDAEGSDGGVIWNSTEPTSSVFSVGTNSGSNGSGNPIIAYCFAEVKGFSKFGSYVGNGNADGTFIYTGFKPAFVITKRFNTTGAWLMYDNKRNTFNLTDKKLLANESGSENLSIDPSGVVQSSNNIDILSNGFKQRTNQGYNNGSGDTYIYMAFAEEPLVGDNPATAR